MSIKFGELSFWLTSFLILIITLAREHESTKVRNNRHVRDLDGLVLSSTLLSKYRLLADQSTNDLGLGQSPISNKRIIRAVDDEDEEESSTTKPSNPSPETDLIEEKLGTVATTLDGNDTVVKTQNVTGNKNIHADYCRNLVGSKTGNESDIQFTNELLQCLFLEFQQTKKRVDVNAAAEKDKSKGDLYLPEGYNKLEVPLITTSYTASNGSQIDLVESPVESQVYLNIREIREMDETEEEVTLDMDVILIWVDGKIRSKAEKLKANNPNLLQAGSIFLNSHFLKSIWTPDLYFEEIVSISNPTFMGKAETVILFPSIGALTYRTRINAKLSCEMNFYYYPADTQECTFTFKSFSYTTKKLVVSWLTVPQVVGGLYLLETSDPNFDFQVSSFSIEDLPIDLGPHTENTTKYSTLKFTIKSRRKLSYHMVQTYIPSAFFVLVTWLCFMIPSDMFEARVGISMTTLLTLTAMFSAVRESTPSVSYVKAIDIWMVACILFLFAALTAFTASEWVKRVLKKLRGSENAEGAEQGMASTERILKDGNERRLFMYEIADKFIEKYLSWLLSMGFVIFLIAYWTWLIVESEYLNWEINPILNRVN